jgi:hypothetical protein
MCTGEVIGFARFQFSLSPSLQGEKKEVPIKEMSRRRFKESLIEK